MSYGSPGSETNFFFHGQRLWGLISPMQFPRTGVLGVGHKPLTPQAEASDYEIPPKCVSLQMVWGFLQENVSASPTCLKVVLLSLVIEELFTWLSGHFQRELFHM